VAGTWRLNRRTAEVALEPFTGLSPDAHEALRAEARDIGRFLGHPDVRADAGCSRAG
jgi:hypothetical protein